MELAKIEDLGALAVVDKGQNFMSFVPTTREDKVKLANVLGATDGESLSKYAGQEIEIENFIAMNNSIEDEVTGEVRNMFSLTLICKGGLLIGTNSKPAWRSLKTILSVFGMPATWDANETLRVLVKETKSTNTSGKFITFEVK